jgi:hypothetical protein
MRGTVELIMRGILLAAAVAIAACTAAPPAGAQSQGDLSGTWAFQTQPYGNAEFGVIMSGVAIMTIESGDRYTINLLANELIVSQSSGQSQLITARQTCTGESVGEQFNISCQLSEPLEGYQPDNFVLQRGEADQLVGVLSSATSGQVTFNRVR